MTAPKYTPTPFRWNDWKGYVWCDIPGEYHKLLDNDLSEFFKNRKSKTGVVNAVLIFIWGAYIAFLALPSAFPEIIPDIHPLIQVALGVGALTALGVWWVRVLIKRRMGHQGSKHLPASAAKLISPTDYQDDVLAELWLSNVQGRDLVCAMAGERKRTASDLLFAGVPALLGPIGLGVSRGGVEWSFQYVSIVLLFLWGVIEFFGAFSLAGPEVSEVTKLIDFWKKRSRSRCVYNRSFFAPVEGGKIAALLISVPVVWFSFYLILGAALSTMAMLLIAIVAIRLGRPFAAWQRHELFMNLLPAADETFDLFVRVKILKDADAVYVGEDLEN